MKRFLTALVLAGVLYAPLGCPTATSTTPPTALAPGYLNAADQRMGQILAAAHAFYTRIQTDSAAGKVQLTQAEKDAFNALGVTLNIAQPTYIAYHNGQATQEQAQASVDAVSTRQAQINAMGVQ